MLLENKVAIVSGSGPNIGGEIARTLAAAGARVTCADVRVREAQARVEEIQTAGGKAIAVETDITDPESVQRMVAATIEAFGRVDILVNDAGISPYGTLFTQTLEDFRRTMDVNVTGMFVTARYAAEKMIEQGQGGAILNIASTSGHRGRQGAIAYATSKGAVLQLTRVLAAELAPHHIRVNSVTPNASGLSLGSGTSREGTPPQAPLGRWGRTTDQAQAVLFLVSPNADFITGVDLPVDGGILSQFTRGGA
jgi:NAD(P)-dependent dehydrogenase (short-subunit alcohol dehydrogenase family)